MVNPKIECATSDLNITHMIDALYTEDSPFDSFKNNESNVYENVRECVLLFENGTQKVFSNNNVKGQLTVNVISHSSHENDFVKSVFSNYKSAKTLKELAEKCGFNCTKTFTRHFKRNFSTTPKQWLLIMRKNELISCLKNTKYPLKHLADELGFSNVSHLSDFCYKKTGMRPEEIRKNKNKNNHRN